MREQKCRCGDTVIDLKEGETFTGTLLDDPSTKLQASTDLIRTVVVAGWAFEVCGSMDGESHGSASKMTIRISDTGDRTFRVRSIKFRCGGIGWAYHIDEVIDGERHEI